MEVFAVERSSATFWTLLNEVSPVKSQWLPEIASFYTLASGESLGRIVPVGGNHKKSAVETKCGKTCAGVKELIQNSVALF